MWSSNIFFKESALRPILSTSLNVRLSVYLSVGLSLFHAEISIGATIRIGREIRCLPYAGFLLKAILLMVMLHYVAEYSLW